MVRIITCASYYGTGSSAITDFFSEFQCVYGMGNYEYRFLQDPDGISDLEYKLVENNHRHNTSDAVKRYLKLVAELQKTSYGIYDVFGNEFDLLTQNYITEIVELKTHTWWNKDRTDKGTLFCEVDRLYSFFKRILNGGLHTEKRFSLLQNKEWGYYTSVSEELFLKATREYVDNLISFPNKNNLPYIMVDQMVPPTNTQRYVRYFNDVRIIVVDRDPRDIFLLEKTRWQWGVIPVDDVREFVLWFQITRKNANLSNEDTSKILRIRFEDMIYKYEETKCKLLSFVGIDKEEQNRQFSYFDPKKSIKNTNLKNKINGYKQEIKYIEDNLTEFLYDFPDL